MSLHASVAAVNITPPVGIDMSGFGNRPSSSIGIHDDLYARALVLSNEGSTLILITSDLISLDFDIIRRLRDQIEARWKIPPGHVMINSSHTHSGPATVMLRGLGERDPDYVEGLTKKILGAVQMAYQELQPALIGWGRQNVQVGINRRRKHDGGRMVIGPNLDGPVAAYVDVLRVEDAVSHEVMAILFAHAAHPVVLGGTNLLISADFPGYAVRLIEQVEPGIAMFAQGCCGNINAHPRDGTFEGARRLGTILGAAVIGGVEQIETTDNVTLRATSRTIQLPFQDPMPVVEAQALVNHYEEDFAEVHDKGIGRPQSYMSRAMLEWSHAMLQAATGEDRPESQPFEIQLFQIGNTAVVGLPGEVFVEYALQLDSRSPYSQTVVLGYTNGCIGYVPTATAYAEGGYEVDTAYRYYGTLMIAPESEELICKTALEMLCQLAERSPMGGANG